MRVLFMVDEWVPYHNAGAETMSKYLARALMDRGHEVEVLLSKPLVFVTEPYEYDDVTIHPCVDPNYDPLPWLDGPKQVDVVISYLGSIPHAVTWGKACGVPVVYILHNDQGYTFEWANDDVALIVSNSEWIAKKVDHPNVVVIPPPVILEDYITTPGNKITLINCCAEKGSKVFYEMARRFPDEEFLAVEGDYGAQVRDLRAKNVEWLDHVLCHFMREAVYSRTKILLMPSQYESYGRTGIEAMASGIPVIASDTPGLRESLGDAGIFVTQGDMDTWEDCLATLVEHESLWKLASDKAKKRVQELDPLGALDRWCDAVEELA